MKQDFYKILGVTRSADDAKIQHAYRVLARRYHPDINPSPEAATLFKYITEAYNTLRNAELRAKYDRVTTARQNADIASHINAYKRAQAASEQERLKKYYAEQAKDYQQIKNVQKTMGKKERAELKVQKMPLKSLFSWVKKKMFSKSENQGKNEDNGVVKPPLIIELNINLREAIFGSTRNVMLNNKEVVKITIPAGTRQGKVIKFKHGEQQNREAYCVIASVGRTEYLHLENPGLVLDMPITVNEAISGTKITIPTLNGEETLTIRPNSNSGTIIRLKDKGIKTQNGYEDLLVMLQIYVPESELAFGIKEKSKDLDQYYEKNVRSNFVDTIRQSLKK